MNLKEKIKYSKAYIITKDKDENDLIDAKEYFEQPDKFLTLNPKIAIGVSPDKITLNHKKLELDDIKKYNQCNLILSSRNINQNSKFLINDQNVKTEVTKRKISIFSLNEKSQNKIKLNNIITNKKENIKERNILNKKKYLTLESKKNNDNIHYKFSTFKDLKKIFKDSIEREKYFKSQGTNDLIPIRTDSNIKKKFFSQEKRLKFIQTAKSNEEKYLKFLAKKCKKEENELLINSIEDFRLKKQLKEYAENNKILSEKFGDNYWLFTLRRSDKNDFIRYNYVNVGNKNREIWNKYIDFPDKVIELINDPYNKTKNKMPILFNFNKNYKNTIPNFKGISEIKIEGQNLAKKEFKDIVDITESSPNKCKFRLYRDPRENNKNYVNNFTCREFYISNTIKKKLKRNNNRFLDKNIRNKRYSFSSKLIKKNL